MQIDLQHPLTIDSIIYHNGKIEFKKIDTNAYNTFLKSVESKTYMDKIKGGKGITDNENQITIYYHGKPREAIRPPWDGGWIWKKDAQGRPWMSVACQGLGASVWYPCKDHQSDEPDNGLHFQSLFPIHWLLLAMAV